MEPKRRASRGWPLAAALLLGGSLLLGTAEEVGAAPSVVLSPTSPRSQGGVALFSDGETVPLSVAGGFLPPDAAVKVIECADPGASVANLPLSVESCDGDTLLSEVSTSDGGVSMHFEFFSLPSATLDETPPGLVSCDLQNPCVLYVGVNQEDFTQPKLFPPPSTSTRPVPPQGRSPRPPRPRPALPREAPASPRRRRAQDRRSRRW